MQVLDAAGNLLPSFADSATLSSTKAAWVNHFSGVVADMDPTVEAGATANIFALDIPEAS